MKPRINLNRSYGWNLSRNNVEITQRIWDGPDCYPWREVYAWLPVQTISGKYVWGCKIYKRKFWAVWGTGFHMEPVVEYGTVFDMLQDTQ
jgi:hypothetical protein